MPQALNISQDSYQKTDLWYGHRYYLHVQPVFRNKSTLAFKWHFFLFYTYFMSTICMKHVTNDNISTRFSFKFFSVVSFVFLAVFETPPPQTWFFNKKSKEFRTGLRGLLLAITALKLGIWLEYWKKKKKKKKRKWESLKKRMRDSRLILLYKGI